MIRIWLDICCSNELDFSGVQFTKDVVKFIIVETNQLAGNISTRRLLWNFGGPGARKIHKL